MTEKDYNPEQRNAKAMTKPVKTSKKTEKVVAPVKKVVETPKEEKIENEFGEFITEKEITDLTERIRKLPDKEIDELWHNIGFIISDREKENKALRNSDIESIKSNLESAKKVVKNMMLESKKEEVIDNLKKMELKQEKKETTETPKEEKKITKPKEKRTEAIVNSHSLPISTKYSVAICKFIKNKKIETAMADLQQVIVKKKAVPMKGEIPHRKGRIMSGRFPKKAAEHFIKVLKTLAANANVNGLNNPVISEAIANLAQRPRGKAGRIKRKRTHVKIVAREKENKKEKKK